MVKFQGADECTDRLRNPMSPSPLFSLLLSFLLSSFSLWAFQGRRCAVQAHRGPIVPLTHTHAAGPDVGRCQCAGSLDLWRKTYRTAGMESRRRALSFDILHVMNNIDGRPPYNFSCLYRPRSQWPWGLACMSRAAPGATWTELLAGWNGGW